MPKPRYSPIPMRSNMFQALRQIRKQLADLTLRLATNPDQKSRTRLVELENQQTQVNQKLAAFRLNKVDDPWINIGTVQGNIPFGSVLINIAKFKVYDFETEESGQPGHYAWIVPASGGGNVQLIPLGDSDKIESKIKALRSACLPQPHLNRIKTEGEKNVEQQLVKLSKDLSETVFAPLEKHLDGVEEIIISPDGDLWTIPWELLRSSKDQYLLEQYRIRYLTSGRELAALNTRPQRRQRSDHHGGPGL